MIHFDLVWFFDEPCTWLEETKGKCDFILFELILIWCWFGEPWNASKCPVVDWTDECKCNYRTLVDRIQIRRWCFFCLCTYIHTYIHAYALLMADTQGSLTTLLCFAADGWIRQIETKCSAGCWLENKRDHSSLQRATPPLKVLLCPCPSPLVFCCVGAPSRNDLGRMVTKLRQAATEDAPPPPSPSPSCMVCGVSVRILHSSRNLATSYSTVSIFSSGNKLNEPAQCVRLLLLLLPPLWCCFPLVL